jgi:hypothetical protein
VSVTPRRYPGPPFIYVPAMGKQNHLLVRDAPNQGDQLSTVEEVKKLVCGPLFNIPFRLCLIILCLFSVNLLFQLIFYFS